MKTIDYSPLTAPITQADMQTYLQTSGDKWALKSMRPLWILVAVVGFFSLGIATKGVGSSFLPFVMFLGLPLVVVVLAMWAMVVTARRRTKLAKFAQVNGATFVRDIKFPDYNGLIFRHGDDRLLKEGLQFAGGVLLGSYEYATGSGKNRQVHHWGYASVPLPRKLPNMVLDSEKNNVLGMFSNLPETFKKDQKLSLEGDFDTHFTLYAPKEYETDALYIFTPDVMQAAMDHGGGYDMEVVDDTFYVYTTSGFDLSKPENIQNLLEIVAKVGGEIAEQGDYYADERVEDRGLNIVAVPGRRLRSNGNLLALLFVLVFMAIYVGIFLLN